MSFDQLRRREFITLLGGAAAAWPVAAWAQQAAMPVIGVLYLPSEAEWADRMAAFRGGLSEMGFIEGRNVTIEYRWADNQVERMTALAADLVRRQVAVIVAGGQAADAALAATRSIPIVFTTGTDPVAAGLVASLNRPGGNATGFTSFNRELASKRLEMLHEILPAARRIALLVNPNDPADAQTDTGQAQTAARRLGLEIIVVGAGRENELEGALAAAVQQGAAALILGANESLSSWNGQIAALALRQALPTSLGQRAAVTAGGLMSYASNSPDMYRQVSLYVGRILKGEKPADLPVLQPIKFELVINLKTAKALGLTIPESFLLRADEVIE
jgi:putative ABC transport system substrate-binding protein